MIRTFIYYPEELDKEIKHFANEAKKSKAMIIREALEEGLTSIKKQKAGGAEALIKIAELGKRVHASGPKDLSANIDAYLWGARK